MRLSLVLPVLLCSWSHAVGVKRLHFANQARNLDAFSLLSRLNSNPYALNKVFPSTPISLSQGRSGANVGAAVGDKSSLGALVGLGGGEAATAGSDAAADQVSDSIKDLFDLPEEDSGQTDAKVQQAQLTPKLQAPPPLKTAAPKSLVVAPPSAARVHQDEDYFLKAQLNPKLQSPSPLKTAAPKPLAVAPPTAAQVYQDELTRLRAAKVSHIVKLSTPAPKSKPAKAPPAPHSVEISAPAPKSKPSKAIAASHIVKVSSPAPKYKPVKAKAASHIVKVSAPAPKSMPVKATKPVKVATKKSTPKHIAAVVQEAAKKRPATVAARKVVRKAVATLAAKLAAKSEPKTAARPAKLAAKVAVEVAAVSRPASKPAVKLAATAAAQPTSKQGAKLVAKAAAHRWAALKPAARAAPTVVVKLPATPIAKLATKQAVKPAAKPIAVKVAARVVAATQLKKQDDAAMLSRQAELEAEVSALKEKLAHSAPPVAKFIVKAAVPATKVPSTKVAKVAATRSAKLAAKPTTKRATTPVVKPGAALALRKQAVVSARRIAAQRSLSSEAKMIEAKEKLAKATMVKRAVAHDFESADDGDDASFAASPRIASPPSNSKVVPVAVASEAAPVAVVPAVAKPSEAPLVTTSILTMTMVPQRASAPVTSEIQEDAITEQAPSASTGSFFGSVGHWFHSLFFAEPVQQAPPPTQAPAPDPNAGRPPFSKQDIERTYSSAHEDMWADIAISDDFARRENEDIAFIDTVKREDRDLRLDAQTPSRPSMPAPANFQHDSGSTHISNFWGTLADEDADIEDALAQDGDDLTEYERLRKLQDAKVKQSVGEISGPLGEHLAIERRALRKSAAAPA